MTFTIEVAGFMNRRSHRYRSQCDRPSDRRLREGRYAPREAVQQDNGLGIGFGDRYRVRQSLSRRLKDEFVMSGKGA